MWFQDFPSMNCAVFLLVCFSAFVAIHGRSVKDKKDQMKDKNFLKFYIEDNNNRILITTEEDGVLRDCYLSGDEYIIELASRTMKRKEWSKVSRNEMTRHIEFCTYAKWSGMLIASDGEKLHGAFGRASAMLIYPGTKWCGAGNVSDGYDDLGPERETDACCREHDHCPDNIEGFGSKHGLDNNSPFTKSNCICDEEFHTCLREVNTESSNRVGKIYFNYLRMECFRYELPAECVKYKGVFRPRCVEYEFDESQYPEWQWFDAKVYKPFVDDGNKLKSPKQDAFEYALQDKSSQSDNFMDVSFKHWHHNHLVNIPSVNIVDGTTITH